MMSEQQWIRVDWRDTSVRLDWFDCTAGFYCVCGANDLLLTDDETEARKCDACGRKYRMVAYLEMQEAPDASRS
jgi:hypothetical protein